MYSRFFFFMVIFFVNCNASENNENNTQIELIENTERFLPELVDLQKHITSYNYKAVDTWFKNNEKIIKEMPRHQLETIKDLGQFPTMQLSKSKAQKFKKGLGLVACGLGLCLYGGTKLYAHFYKMGQFNTNLSAQCKQEVNDTINLPLDIGEMIESGIDYTVGGAGFMAVGFANIFYSYNVSNIFADDNFDTNAQKISTIINQKIDPVLEITNLENQ